jgi:hypothetical protein
MNYASISADVVSYTSLSTSERRMLENGIKQLLDDLKRDYQHEDFIGRLVQGDYIECALKNPKYGLRIALLLKTYIKSMNFGSIKGSNNRLKYFSEHGIRFALAVAPLSKLDAENGIIDGEAIFLSGRMIKSQSTSGKQKIVIKNTMFFCSPDENLQEQMNVILSLLDTIISKLSAKQSEVVFYKLLNLGEREIAKKLNKNQSTISQHSTAGGWISLEKAVLYFEKIIV